MQVPLRLISLALQVCSHAEEQENSGGCKIFVSLKKYLGAAIDNLFGQGGHPVFCSLDLASSLKVADGKVTKVAEEQLVEGRSIVREVAESILQMVEAKSNVTGLMTTFPTVVSVIRPGTTPVPYTESHVDLYSYKDSALHFTSILYLQGADIGGELYLEREEEEERKVEAMKGTLLTFTSGEENRHRVAEVMEGVRVALTIFFTCDQDFHLDI